MFKSIIWATDGSEHAKRALSYVTDLAQAGENTSVTIVHVVETGRGAGAAFLPQRQEEDEIIEQLKAIEGDLRAKGLDVSLQITDELGVRPAHEILAVARAKGADLIILASRGASAIGGLILGSTAHRLLHVAPCPVLVVPSERRAAQ